MAKILITGGTGLVGLRLSQHLVAAGHDVVHLSRNPSADSDFPAYQWDLKRAYIDSQAFSGVEYIVHLAGAGIADQRWTRERKKVILESRTEPIKLLLKEVTKLNIKLKAFISASAIGYYGFDTGDKWVDESTMPGDDFLADVVKQWESSADLFSEYTKVAKIRIGVVLSEKGGAMKELVKPIKFMVGAPLGTGKQYMSWIHIDDLTRIFQFAIDTGLTGIVNAVAPNPVTNQSITRELASALGKPLFLPNVPALGMKLILGEMAAIVLGGNRVSSAKIQGHGFRFQFENVKEAISHLLTD